MEEKRMEELSLTPREKNANSGEEETGGPPLVHLSCLGVTTYTPRRSPGREALSLWIPLSGSVYTASLPLFLPLLQTQPPRALLLREELLRPEAKLPAQVGRGEWERA